MKLPKFYLTLPVITSMLSSCTMSFINMHTQGEASDLVDSQPTSEIRANPNVSLVPKIPDVQAGK